MPPTSSRLDIVDALRGFAIVSIMLLHNLEHFDLYHKPAGQPAWLAALDQNIWDGMFFLFAGKSYLIFALLFGVTFHLQDARRAAAGEDFRPRFAWRMLLLLGFGMLNSLFYQGDILSFYAVMSFTLLPVARLGSRAVLAIAALLMLQPYLWVHVLQALPQPDAKLPDPASWAYFARTTEYMTGGTMLQTYLGNVTTGKTAAVLWSWENGRFFQIPALFMLGMLAGRAGMFALSDTNRAMWRRLLVVAVVCFAVLYAATAGLDAAVTGQALRRPLLVIVKSWSNFALMGVIVAGFTLLYQRGTLARLLNVFAPLGRMSLTSYVSQSVVGTALYYSFGLGLYQYTGATACLLIGAVLALLQGLFSAWWLKRHKQGPLEALWHRATWAGVTNPGLGRPAS
ncbi:DUF418 domain-containing protein [Pseudoduganella umbonata]|uniref:DUF418 domain-containing protein n=1 Tax=Pseudoduganella umbonata TaxID=864828 RepID=A0A4P8HZU1_9BURK|nr:DUF418 domain-containing protein [Pseudoduganella umbonata]MBB3224155.1 uncharacterized protein [Pseudoduganella umbonata]QCP13985.1 DUF418 domain-containing protein [Pseudoduganella umbonata]